MTMSEECVIITPLEWYLMENKGLEGFTFVPASQLHRPGLQKQSVLKKRTKSLFQHELTCINATRGATEKTQLNRGAKRKGELQNELQVCCGLRKVLARRDSCLPQQNEVYQKLADISNLKRNDCEKNLTLTKENNLTACAAYKHGENNVTKDKLSCANQHKPGSSGQDKRLENKLSEPGTIKRSTASKRKLHSKNEGVFTKNDRKLHSKNEGVSTKNDSPGKVGTQNKDKQNCDNTEQVIPAKRRRQIETLVPTELPENVPLRSKRVRKQNYQLEDTDTSILESVKKTRVLRKVFCNKLKEQDTNITKDRNMNSDYEERAQDKTEKIPEPSVEQSARKALQTKETEINGGTKSNSDEHREGQVLLENTQSKSECVEVMKVERTRGRPKENQELTKDITNVSESLLRRSTRQRKIKAYSYCIYYETPSVSTTFRQQEKIKDKSKAVANIEAAKSNVRHISQKDSKKSICDEKLETLKACVCLDKINLLKYQCPSYKDKENDVNSRGRETNKSRKDEEKQCKESEKESTVKTQNANTKTVSNSKQQTKKSKKPEKPQSEGLQSAEDCKITAKKGTLKYLHQREKYITALAREAEGEDDDFSENSFFVKKKFQFTNLLPPSHEDTLVIKTPKRGNNEPQENAVVTPRTAMLGQLRPVTPTTQPHSPCPSLDSNTKKDALKQVYQLMKNKGHQPRRSRKVLHDTSQQNINFTPLELPTVPESQSGNESDIVDEYFDDEDSL